MTKITALIITLNEEKHIGACIDSLAGVADEVLVIDSLSTDKNKTYHYVEREFEAKYQIKWLKPIGFNNAYALMMREKQAKQLNIKTISDLKRYLESK